MKGSQRSNLFFKKLPCKICSELCQHSKSFILSELSGGEDRSEAVVSRLVSGQTELGEEQTADLVRPSLGCHKHQAQPRHVRPPGVSASGPVDYLWRDS